MREPRFTPDPWKWDGEEEELRDGLTNGGTLVGADGEHIIETDSGFYPPYGDDRDLIKASPKMYKALEKIAKEPGRASVWMEDVRLALALARPKE